jgi:hypothetical protein
LRQGTRIGKFKKKENRKKVARVWKEGIGAFIVQ